LGSAADANRNDTRQGFWVPAFAGTTWCLEPPLHRFAKTDQMRF